MEMAVTIGLMMMVKNEEQHIEQAILSVKDLVDEILIGDTGSTDKTIEIASQYGRVISLPFIDYVTTRQQIMDELKTDYIVMLDADERFVLGHDALRKMAEEGADGVLCPLDMLGETGEPELSYLRYILWKNDDRWRFVGPGVHESLVGGEFAITYDAKLIHYWKKPNPVLKLQIYSKYLLFAIAEDSGNMRAWFYLARAYKDAEMWVAAILAYQKYLALFTSYTEEIWQANHDLAVCYRSIGELNKAIEYSLIALKVCPWRAETYNLLGMIYFYDFKQPLSAIGYFEKSRTLLVPENGLFVMPKEYTQIPDDILTLCYWETEQWNKALFVCRELNDRLEGKDKRIADNLVWCLSKGV